MSCKRHGPIWEPYSDVIHHRVGGPLSAIGLGLLVARCFVGPAHDELLYLGAGLLVLAVMFPFIIRFKISPGSVEVESAVTHLDARMRTFRQHQEERLTHFAEPLFGDQAIARSRLDDILADAYLHIDEYSTEELRFFVVCRLVRRALAREQHGIIDLTEHIDLRELTEAQLEVEQYRSLPIRQRAALLLTDDQDMTVKDIARICACDDNDVKLALRAARGSMADASNHRSGARSRTGHDAGTIGVQ